MAQLNVIRKNIMSNVEEVFEFPYAGYDFLIKNLTGSGIVACIENYSDTKNIKIPSQVAQVMCADKWYSEDSKFSRIIIKGSESGEVEIQCLR